MNLTGTFRGGPACPAERSCTIPGSLRTFSILAALAVLSALLQAGLRLWLHRAGLHVPGISALAWMPLMVAGKAKRPRGMSASGMALVLGAADALVMPVFGPGSATWSLLAATPLKYGASALILDLSWPIVSKIRPGSLAYPFAVSGTAALALAGKALFVPFSCALSGIPLPAGRSHIVALHLAFGACAGLVTAFMSARERPAGP